MGTTFGIIAGLAGTAISAAGTFIQAQQQADRAEMNAALARREAQRRRQRAGLQHRAAEAEESRRRRVGRRRLAGVRAGFAGSGVTLQGTPTDVLADRAMEVELEAQQAAFEGDLATLNTLRGAQASRVEAQQAEQRASSLRTAGAFSAGSTLLTGGARAGQQSGMFSGGSSGTQLEGRITPQTGFT